MVDLLDFSKNFFPSPCKNINWNVLSKIKIFGKKGISQSLHREVYYCYMDDVFHYLFKQ